MNSYYYFCACSMQSTLLLLLIHFLLYYSWHFLGPISYSLYTTHTIHTSNSCRAGRWCDMLWLNGGGCLLHPEIYSWRGVVLLLFAIIIIVVIISIKLNNLLFLNLQYALYIEMEAQCDFPEVYINYEILITT